MSARAEQAIAAAYAAFRSQNFAAARRLLAGFQHPQALHLLALIEKNDGNPELALRLLNKAQGLHPDDPEIANNLGNVLRDLGDRPGAERAYRQARQLRPGFTAPGTALGRLLIDQERWDEAHALYDELGREDPASLPVRYGKATVTLARGQPERAEALLDELLDAFGESPEVRFMRGRARAEQGRAADAVADFSFAFDKAPSAHALRALAAQHWMLGDRETFGAVLRSTPSERSDLAILAASLLRESGAPEDALAALAPHLGDDSALPDAWIVAAASHIDLEDADAARAAARKALRLSPDHRVAIAHLIVAELISGRADIALEPIMAMRAAEPEAQHWIAYEVTVRHLLGDEQAGRLLDYDRHIRAHSLPVPEGFDSIEAFNAAFGEVLERWHTAAAHPLDQSLRFGSQTPRDVMSIESPVVAAFRQALDEPIREYLAAIGKGDGSPVASRNTGGYRVQSCWSVKLSGGGYHVNHVHPEGWISSAYYVSVPPEVSGKDSRSGWIKFGEPPFPTAPASQPAKWIEPRAGLLVLFPSYTWHGTEPILDGSTRVTAPFDLVPAA